MGTLLYAYIMKHFHENKYIYITYNAHNNAYFNQYIIICILYIIMYITIHYYLINPSLMYFYNATDFSLL